MHWNWKRALKYPRLVYYVPQVFCQEILYLCTVSITYPSTIVMILLGSFLRSCNTFGKLEIYSFISSLMVIPIYSFCKVSSPPILATSRLSASSSLFKSFRISVTKAFWASFNSSTCFTISLWSFLMPFRVSSRCEGPFAKEDKYKINQENEEIDLKVRRIWWFQYGKKGASRHFLSIILQSWQSY